MTERPIIVLLEDSPSRVKWIRREFPDVEVVWVETVNELFDALDAVDRGLFRLLILDHDLGDKKAEQANRRIDAGEDLESALARAGLQGGGTWPLDANGCNGMTAVDMLTKEHVGDVPVLVWSINTPRAQEMVLRLKDKGIPSVWIPHVDSRESMLEKTIAWAVAPNKEGA